VMLVSGAARLGAAPMSTPQTSQKSSLADA
jgi:hypothetical protein